MSAHRNIDKICIVVLVLTLLLTVLFMNGEKLGIQVIADEDAEGYNGTEYFTENDLDGTWSDNAYTTYITLSGDTASIKGNGAYAYDGGVVIKNGGWYVLSGTLTDGSITVDAYDSSKVWLRLEGVDINCEDDACLIVDQAEKVFLTLAEGSENSFTSGSDYSAEAIEDNTGGVIFSHDDLTINGSGSLTVTGSYKHGIDANDSLVITGGTVSITAPQDGIHVNDSFRFTAADLSISAGDDAIHSDGELYVESGKILVSECYEGLEALTIDIAGGDITVCARDDGFNANGGSSSMTGGMGGRGGMGRQGGMTGVTAETASAEDTETTEEETWIRISGGTVTILNETGNDADGLDSNGNIYLEGGIVRISLKGDGGNCAIDYGSESGGECIVTGGTVIACGGSSMVEEFSSASTQCAVLYNLSSTASSGTAFRVLDADGNEILSETPECSYSSVAFSSPDLTVGESYTVSVGEESAELTLDSTAVTVGSSGGMGGGMGGMQQGEMPGGQEEGSDQSESGSFPDWGGEGNSDHPSPFESGDESERPDLPGGEMGSRPEGETGTPPNGEMGSFPGDHGGESGHRRPGRPGEENGETASEDLSFPEEGSEGTDQGNAASQDERSEEHFSGESPDFSGEGFGGGEMGGFGPGAETETAESETPSSGLVSLGDLDKNAWILLGISGLVLIAGLLFAAKYRK